MSVWYFVLGLVIGLILLVLVGACCYINVLPPEVKEREQ